MINFIDFKKAFENVHRESLRRMTKTYGIPSEIIGIIQSFYDASRCAARYERMVSDCDRSATRMCVVTNNFALVGDWVTAITD